MALSEIDNPLYQIDTKTKITNMTCCNQVEPLGIDTNPVFSWNTETYMGGKFVLNHKIITGYIQDSYRIFVATDPKLLTEGKADMWDSGKVETAQSVSIPYQGKALEPATVYYWGIRTVGHSNSETSINIQSPAASFETGLMQDKNWNAVWIGSDACYKSGWSMLYRKEFSLQNRPIVKARAYVSALGFYELSLNGEKVGDHVLDPIQTDYEARVFYSVYDITDRLQEGANCVGIMAGDGWYHQSRVWLDINNQTGLYYGDPKVIAEFRITYSDGTVETIATDQSWKTNPGPISQNNIYAGETYDSRISQTGWDCADYDQSGWYPVSVSDEPVGALTVQSLPPIKKMEEFSPVDHWQIEDGIYVYDMGKNFAGWVRLKIKAAPGVEITMKFAEDITSDRRPFFETCGTYATRVIQTDRYICHSYDEETFEPKFTYHGFRYVQIEGIYWEMPTLTAVRVYNSVDTITSFHCSDETINQIHELVDNTVRSNLHGQPTDCPAREKCGWTGDALIMSDVFLTNWDTTTFLQKYIKDIETTRSLRGMWTNIVPGLRLCLDASPAWGNTQVVIPWLLYLLKADTITMREQFDAICAWIDHIGTLTENYIITYLGYELDDWCKPQFHSDGERDNETTMCQVATLSYYQAAKTAEKIAAALGNTEKAAVFSELSQKIADAFHQAFYVESKGSYLSHCVDSFALALGAVPKECEKTVAAALNDSIKQCGYHVWSGHIGIKYVFPVLCQYGYLDTIHAILQTDTYPGLTNLLKKGATTLYEHWEYDGKEHTTGSLNHPFKGGIDMWFFNSVLGLRAIEPGYRVFAVNPAAHRIVDHAEGSHRSPYGTIGVKWQKTASAFQLELTVPANMTAHITLPTAHPDQIQCGGAPLTNNLPILERTEKETVIEAKSGIYKFCCKLNGTE